MSATKASHRKSKSEAGVSKSEQRKRDEDDGGDIINDIKGIMSALLLMKEKTQKDVQTKKQETISRQTSANALWKSSKECGNSFKTEEWGYQYSLVDPKEKTMPLMIRETTVELIHPKVPRCPLPMHPLPALRPSSETTIMHPRPALRPSSERSYVPFLLSRSARTRSYQLYFRDREEESSTVWVDFPGNIDITRWRTVAHNANSGWILLVRGDTVVYYNVVEHRWFAVPYPIPVNFGDDCFDQLIFGCFSGDSEQDNNLILLLCHKGRWIRVFRYCRERPSWVTARLTSHHGHDPVSHINDGENLLWVDNNRRMLHAIHDWKRNISTEVLLHHTEMVLPPKLVIQATVSIGRKLLLVAFMDGMLTVFRLKFVGDEVQLKPWDNFKGNNVYAVSMGTGFGIRPEFGGRDGVEYVGNMIFFSGIEDFHCLRYRNLNDLTVNQEHLCFDPRHPDDAEANEDADANNGADVEANNGGDAEANNGGNAEAWEEDEEDNGICKCSNLWFYIVP